MKRKSRSPIVLMLVAFLISSCASGKIEKTRQYVPDAAVVRPSGVYVYNFATDPSEALADTFGPDYGGDSDADPEDAAYRKEVANLMAEQLVSELQERGITAMRATVDATQLPLHAIAVKGQFVTIDEGNKRGRVLIGFGRGNSELQANIQTYQMRAEGLSPLAETEGSAHGSRKPGMLVPVAIAASTGKKLGVVVGAATTVKSEVSGVVETDVKNLAEAFAERAEDFYKRQGWK